MITHHRGTIRAQKESIQALPFDRCARRSSELTFSPMAWLKLRLFLHADNVEVAGFGISAPGDLLYVEDFVSVEQTVSLVTVDLDDHAVADHFDECIDVGIPPERCGRIWIHTHPGISPEPSDIDEQTFERVFGKCDWAVMAIIARGGATYARLRFNIGPGGESIIPIRVDWERFPRELLDREHTLDSAFTRWLDEYGRNIHHRPVRPPLFSEKQPSGIYANPVDQLDAIYDMRFEGDLIAAMSEGADPFFQEADPWR